MDIYLPKNHFFVSCGSQQVVVGCFGNLYVGEIFAEEPYEVGVEGEGAFQVFVGNVVGRFLRLGLMLGLRLRLRNYFCRCGIWMQGIGIGVG